MDREKINYLYSRYKAQQLSPEEEKEWAALLADPEQDPKLRSIVGADWDGLDLRQLKSLPGTKAKRILNEILLMPQFKVQRKNYWWSGAAAAVAILILATWFFNPFGDPDD